MPNFETKPEGMSYAQWLREKNVGITITEAIHADSGLPHRVHNAFKNKPQEEYDMALDRQGKQILPEDM